MKRLLYLLLFCFSCASVTLPDGTKLETRGEASASILAYRGTWSPPIIPFSGRVESEIKGSDIPGCPYLKRSYFDENDKLINEEYTATCDTAIYVKSEITAWQFLQVIAGMWAAAGFP